MEKTIYTTEAFDKWFARLRDKRARARSMSQIAKETGLGRESLYKALSGEGNPSFATILKVCHALGVELRPQVIAGSGQ